MVNTGKDRRLNCFVSPLHPFVPAGTFKSSTLTLEQIDSLAQEYLESIERGTFKDGGWPQSAYGVSKVLLNAYTRMLAEQLHGRPEGHK